jgi:hypothetical protein
MQIANPILFSTNNKFIRDPQFRKIHSGNISRFFIVAIFVAWMLLKTKGLSYAGRVSFVVIFALAASIVTDIPYWNWFGFDLQYTLVTVADLLIGWFFAGLVLAKLCKNERY